MKKNLLKRTLAMLCALCLMAGMTTVVSADHEQRHDKAILLTTGDEQVFIYGAEVWGGDYQNQEVAGLSYDADANVLTMKDYDGSNTNMMIRIANSDKEFKIKVEGTNKLGSLTLRLVSATIYGEGSLTINESKKAFSAISVEASGGTENDKITIAPTVTLTAYKGTASAGSSSEPNTIDISYTASKTSPLVIEGSAADGLKLNSQEIMRSEDAYFLLKSDENIESAEPKQATYSLIKKGDPNKTYLCISSYSDTDDKYIYKIYESVGTTERPVYGYTRTVYLIDGEGELAEFPDDSFSWDVVPIGYEIKKVGTGEYSHIYTSDVIKITPKADEPASGDNTGNTATVDEAASAAANEELASKVETVAEGGTVTVSVAAQVEIKQETLQALKDKDQKLELTSTTAAGEEITWTIDKVTEAVAFNPTVTLEAKIEAVEAKLEAASVPTTTKITEVTFDHHGTLPGTAKVKLPLSNTKFTEGATVHLYYFDPVAKLFEKIDSATYTNGAATFTMTHCSDYVVTSEELPAALIKKAPGTGAYLNGSVYVMLLLLGAVAVAVGIKRKDFI